MNTVLSRRQNPTTVAVVSCLSIHLVIDESAHTTEAFDSFLSVEHAWCSHVSSVHFCTVILTIICHVL